jgi:hypothetical protein
MKIFFSYLISKHADDTDLKDLHRYKKQKSAKFAVKNFDRKFPLKSLFISSILSIFLP